MIQPAFEILNQRGTPMFFSDVFANRPTAGIVGRIFISTDTKEFYRDTGSTWELIGGPGSGTITGSGTAGTLPIWTALSVLGDSSLLEGASKISTIKDIQADAYYLSGMTAGNGALYWTSDRVTLANYNVGGSVYIEVNGGNYAQVIAANLSTTFYGDIIRNGGLSTQFLKADGSVDSSNYITTNIYNGNGTLTGNRDVSLNSNYLSFAGGQTYIGSQTTSSGLLTINNSSADSHVQVVGANSPSIRIDNAGTGATRRFVMGLSTATNNFIQGSTAGDICISTASASPMLFGMWQTINASEVMRISTANNLLIGTVTDFGFKLNVNNSARIGNASGGILISADGGSGNIWTDISSPLRLGANGIEYMRITTGGNVGISTSIPAYRLDIFANANASIAIGQTSDDPFIWFDRSDGGSSRLAWRLRENASRALIFETGSSTTIYSQTFTEAMRITSAGNLLIGTTTDSGYKLRVNGAIFSDDYIQANNNITAKGTFQGFGPASGSGVFLSYEPYGGRLESYDYATQSYKNINISPNGGNVTIGNSATVTQKLYLNGSLRIDGQLSATAGGSSGQHLIINCDGTTYKIALLNN